MSRLLLIFFLLPVTGFASKADSAGPHRATWCASLFLNTPPEAVTYSGDLHYYLKNMNGVAIAVARNLAERKLTSTEKIMKVIQDIDRTIFNYYIPSRAEPKLDYSQAHDEEVRLNFLDPQSMKWSRANKLQSEKLIGRLRQLETDFTTENAALMAFGFTQQGDLAIRDFVKDVETRDADLEKQMGLETQFPFRSRYNNVFFSAAGLFFGWGSYENVSMMIKHLQSPSPASFMLSLLDLALLRYSVQPAGMISADYLSTFFGERMRDRYLRRYDPLRVWKSMNSNADHINQGEKHPDALIYSGYSMPISFPLANALRKSAIQKVAFDPELLAQEIKAQRAKKIEDEEHLHLLVDQMFFFDSQTHEPVLVTFIRIKLKRSNAPKIPKRKNPKQRAPKWQDSLVPGLSG